MMADCYSRNMSPIQCVCDNKLTCCVGRSTAIQHTSMVLMNYLPVTVLPWVKSPEENPVFQVHFTRQWQDTLVVSLHNFLATIFQVCLLIVSLWLLYRLQPLP
jgi:hypothetical protein